MQQKSQGTIDAWLTRVLGNADLIRMGHGQRREDLNLGLGWVYYGLARSLRPKLAVVIGSFRGFVPLMIGKALTDNLEDSRVVFIDPSFVDPFWKDAEAVRAHFAHYGVSNIEHHLMTTQDFAKSEAYQQLDEVGMLFVDGFHSEEQARFDYETFEPLLAPDALTLFHDTRRCRPSNIYGADRPYEHQVKRYMDVLKRDDRLQVFDLPFGDGVTLVRKATVEPDLPMNWKKPAAQASASAR